jgi:hypothetical protein
LRAQEGRSSRGRFGFVALRRIAGKLEAQPASERRRFREGTRKYRPNGKWFERVVESDRPQQFRRAILLHGRITAYWEAIQFVE